MRKKLKKVFIPHHENDYRPSLFEYTGIAIVLSFGILFFVSSVAVNRYVVNTNQGAAVYSSVLVDLTNKVRLEKEVTELTVSDILTKAAEMKASDMAEKQYFAHTSPDGTTPWYWFQKANYNFVFAGENLAVDFTESEDVENAWLASPKHNENIVDPRFTEIGIATKTANWQGRQTTFVVQLFGTPTTASAYTKTANTTVASEKNNEASNDANIKNTEIEKPEPKNIVRVISETPATILGINETASYLEKEEAVNTPVVVSSSPATNEVAVPSPKASLIDKAVVRIPNVSKYALLALAGMVLLGLILFVFIEVRRQHPGRVLIGALVFIFLCSLAYTSQAFILPI